MGKVELHIEVDAELAARAEAHGVVLGAALEAGIKTALARQSLAGERTKSPAAGMEEAARQLADENAEAIEAYRRRIDERGMFGEDLRRW